MNKKTPSTQMKIYGEDKDAYYSFRNQSLFVGADLIKNELKFPLIDSEILEREAANIDLEDTAILLEVEGMGLVAVEKSGNILCGMAIFWHIEKVYNEVKQSSLPTPEKRNYLTKHSRLVMDSFRNAFRTKRIIFNIEKQSGILYNKHVSDFEKLREYHEKVSAYQLTLSHDINTPLKLMVDAMTENETVKIGDNAINPKKFKEVITDDDRFNKADVLFSTSGDAKIIELNALKLFRENKNANEAVISAADFLKKCGYDIDGMNNKTRNDLYKCASQTIRNLSRRNLIMFKDNAFSVTTGIFQFTAEKCIKVKGEYVFQPLLIGDIAADKIESKLVKLPGQIVFKFAGFEKLVYDGGSGFNYNLSVFFPFLKYEKRTRDKLIDVAFCFMAAFSTSGRQKFRVEASKLKISSRDIKDKIYRSELISIFSDSLLKNEGIEIVDKDDLIEGKKVKEIEK